MVYCVMLGGSSLFACVPGSTISVIQGRPVMVEVDVAGGLPCLEVVGMADTALRESKHRVRSALRNSGFHIPSRRITVSLAPAAVHKEGSQLDAAIALGILAASGEIPVNERLGEYCYLGELALDGSLRPVRGALTMALSARESGMMGVVVPAQNSHEVSFLEGMHVLTAGTLLDLAGFVKGACLPVPKQIEPRGSSGPRHLDLSEIRGQAAAKRALEVAAAGGHNLLLVGTPGSGKSMLARAVPSILPVLSFQESVAVTRIHGVAGVLPEGSGLVRDPPFRAPHHTVTSAALMGGGTSPSPGEITLAHRGVLFLDELPEFSPSVLNALRQPLEEGQAVIVRSKGTYVFPCRFLLVAAMNPCKCGWFTDDFNQCTCTESARRQYVSRVSGPLFDRIDLHLEVGRVKAEELGEATGEESAAVRARVRCARDRQNDRFRGMALAVNGEMSPKDIGSLLSFSSKARRLALDAYTRMNLSARGYYRVLKVSATIADLCSSPRIEEEHVAEALAYRQRGGV